MFNLQEFLETSTIHGLQRIATSRKKFQKMFWFLAISVGFSVAALLIVNAFRDYDVNPFISTIETFPISQLKFPSILVCPPKGTYTNLNYDLGSHQKKGAYEDTNSYISD